jgi:hypothetical protein
MAITLDPPEVVPAASPARGSSPRSPKLPGPPTISWVQWLVATLLVGAGAVHLALAPSHFGESTVEGIGFVVAAWLQLALAVAVLLRPTRVVVFATIAVSAACIGAWAVSRIWGLPLGGEAGHVESVTVVDSLTVVMEAFTVVLAATLLSSSVRQFRSRGYGLVAVVAVLGLTTGLLAAPEARDHAAAHGGHTHDQVAAGAAVPAAHTHDHSTAAGSTSGAVTDLNGQVVKGVKAHDVAHELEPDQLLDAPTRALLASQLTAARAAALAYPTVADAERAGYRLVGGAFGPGAGAHYVGFGGGAFGTFDPAHPPTLIYDGITPGAHVVGLMYLGMGEGGTAPEGFAGPNDHWHRHSGVCQKAGKIIFPVDADVTEAQCKAQDGFYMATTTWMVHAWVVPGWESSAGVFSHENPNLPCADGTFDADPIGGCTGPGDVG